MLAHDLAPARERQAVHRPATPSDLGAVYSIYMEKGAIPYLGLDPMPLADFDNVFDELLASKEFHVVEVAKKVEGFYRLSYGKGRSSHVAQLSTLAVAPERRGTGFPSAIMETALKSLEAVGVIRVELVVEEDNPRALSFYRKTGFECEGILRGAYKRSCDDHYVDGILMARIWSPLKKRDVP